MTLRSVMRYVFALSALLISAVWAAQAPPASLQSTLGPNPLRSSFRSGEKADVISVELGVLKKAVESGKSDFSPPLIGLSRGDEIRQIPKGKRTLAWSPMGDGYIARANVSSKGAAAIRVGLHIEWQGGDTLEVRSARNSQSEPLLIQAMAEDGDAKQSSLLWTPVSEGESQFIELYSLTPAQVIIDSVSHFTRDPFIETNQGSSEKLLSCEQNYSCSTDANIKQNGPAVAKLIITVPGGGSFLCSGALLNDRLSSGTPWFTTATHCGITTSQIASNVQFLWFYEQVCGAQSIVSSYATTVGSQLLVDDTDTDFTFLKLTGPLPGGLRSLGWNTNALVPGDAVYGIHHPTGSPKAYSTGTFTDVETINFRTETDVRSISGNAVNWQVGNTEGGSSGSPLITGAGQLRGTLTAGPAAPTCDASRPSYYSRFALAYPLIRSWIDPQTVQDDFANSASATYTTQPQAYDSILLQGTINSIGDEDWFRFSFPSRGDWLLATGDISGSTTNLMTQIYASDGTTLLQQRDQNTILPDGRNSGFLNHVLEPTTIFVRTTGVNGSTGNYKLVSLYYPADDHSDIPLLGDVLAPNGAASGAIDRPGDRDYFIIDLPSAGTLTLSTSGSTDTVGFLYDSQFSLVSSNDDATPTNRNFLIQKQLQAGRYYLAVLGYDITVLGQYSLTSTFSGPVDGLNGANAKTLGSRATVEPTTPMYGAFELAQQSLVYILVRGNSLGSLGVTPSYLDAPRLRLFDSQGQDLLHDAVGAPGIAGCTGTVANYYASARQQPADQRDACVAQTLPAGVYTFNVSPSSAGLISSTGSGEVLFEVTLANGAGALTKTLGSRAAVNSAQPMYGAFELSQPTSLYVLVRGDSLGTLGVTPNFLDAPRLRLFDSQGHDILHDAAGVAGIAGCSGAVADYYANARHQSANSRDACTAQTLAAGVYTFNITPSSSDLISTSPGGGEVLFEVTLRP